MSAEGLAAVIQRGLRCAYQPIVDLRTGEVVAHEALARGPEGPWEAPADLFAEARRHGLLAELDRACRVAAIRGAVEHDLVAPLTVFVNVEPEVIDAASTEDLLSIADQASGRLRIVVELTERALAEHPAEMLRTVERVRELGWAVALDDVGAESASLAFMALLRPEVVKLDLSLVQATPSASTAEVMHAVNAYAERSGALVLAEGIEIEEHLRSARALGAVLGQGWLLGRPTKSPAPSRPTDGLVLRTPASVARPELPGSPFAALPPDTTLTVSPKRLLIEVSRQLEREATRLGRTCVVAATFQHERHFTPSTARRYQDLVDCTGFVLAVGEGLEPEPLPGLRSAVLTADDPVCLEWDVVVLSPHFSAALLARDLRTGGDELERQFEYALTYDREVVTRAAHELMLRVAPRRHPIPSIPLTEEPQPAREAEVRARRRRRSDRSRDPMDAHVGPEAMTGSPLLHRALSAITNGLTIVDIRASDQPLIYVNRAFELLSGFDAEDLVGRNCRLLQGPATDQRVVARMRDAIARGEPIRETVLNVRGPAQAPWWNEVHLFPVTDPRTGESLHYIGVQTDVTEQVRTGRALAHESERARSYLQRVESLANTDPLTGLMNRRRFEATVEDQLAAARAEGAAMAIVFMDLDDFKPINDTLGHTVGDALLVEVARRLQARVRASDLLARFGGDEFLVAVSGLTPGEADVEAGRIALDLAAALTDPMDLSGRTVRTTVSYGVAVFPQDAEEFGPLLHLADLRMYERKRPRRLGRAR